MTTAPPTYPTEAQVTMTLATLAATAATPRPSGETVAEQTRRALTGIAARLTDSSLATGDTWLPMWLAMRPDNGNLVYIAWNTAANQFAVVVRGTVSAPTDMMEDLDVGTLVPFTAGRPPSPVAVSAGATAAFTQVVNTPGLAYWDIVQDDAKPALPAITVTSGTTLPQALLELLTAAYSSPTVYVTGHSLGGCVATMLAPYLQKLRWPNTPQFGLITFAAPTAGVASFARYVDSLSFNPSARYVNAWDLVPCAWSDLDAPKDWYPKDAGPRANVDVKFLLTEIDMLRKGNVYVQPQAAGTTTMNGDYAQHDPQLVNKTLEDYLGQVAFQHANSTYLMLLGAPLVPPGPLVTSLSTTSGAGGATVTISGSGFDPDSVVDFGPIPCAEFSLNSAGTQISATVPDGAGIVDVRVTTKFGTSPAVPLGRFAYGGPAPVVVTSVSPNKGGAGTPVKIYGSGFADKPAVMFRETAGDNVNYQSPTLITASVPKRTEEHPRTVDVTVTIGVATSPTTSADEFSYPKILPDED
ncbi:IPT/TIG domain-containing protein [Streptomyces sp. NPDC050428]|uniref:IPT/TIG domain-containing protein n=1 Tax=Streptomyces sp. NPDC050428 TaxID=3155757 RepID=UPI00342BD658